MIEDSSLTTCDAMKSIKPGNMTKSLEREREREGEREREEERVCEREFNKSSATSMLDLNQIYDQGSYHGSYNWALPFYRHTPPIEER